MNPQRISRRSAMKRVAGVLSSGAVASAGAWIGRARAAEAAGEKMRASVLLNEPIANIKPALYSHFAEHIGGVIYDGVWVGPGSKIANVDGIRKALVEHVRRLGPVVMRWPGGCFADRYDWTDGIGPREKRPRRFGRWEEATESNAFGTHEFLRFCRLCAVEPYLAANVGSGTVEQFQRWVEYCNAPAGRTTLADQRAANGDPEPFGIRYWGVGNESWGCGGKFTPEDYCTEYRKFTEWVPGYGVPHYLIAAGPSGNDLNWTRRFFKKWNDYAKAPLHGWAAHYYCGTTGQALEFTVDQWYEMLDKANQMERLIVDQWAAMGEFDREHTVKLTIDEWGTWHKKGSEINKRHLFGQQSCLRDALVAALTLDTFNRHAEKIDMANIAQLVNCLQSLFLADGDKFVTTPNFHVFEMYRPHQSATAVRVDVQAPTVGFRTTQGSKELFRVAGSASRSREGLTFTLVHTHVSEPATVAIDLRGGSAKGVRQTELAHEKLDAHNTFERPDEVVPGETRSIEAKGSTIEVRLLPASITRLDVLLG